MPPKTLRTSRQGGIDHLERVNSALASVPYTSVDEPPRQEFSRKFFFSELEGLDNPPWWFEWKRR